MLPIQGPSPVAPAAPKPRAAAAAGGNGRGFGVAPPGTTPPETAAGGVGEAALAGMLALQEGIEPHAATPYGAGGAAMRDRQARRRSRDLLEALAALQRAMLAGPDDGGTLAALAALAAAPPEAADPALRRILADIRLRARVELARYEIE